MKPVILFRDSIEFRDEQKVAREYFPVYNYRTEVPAGSLVIPRYATWPYYRELETDLANLGSSLINSYEQHRWVASFDYYEEIKQHTFETWDYRDFYRCDYPGPFVVKGRTSSRKLNWNRMMFAETKRDVHEVAGRLLEDSIIGEQGIIVRKYEKLKQTGIGGNGLPFTEEWRFFVLNGKIISSGYYWSIQDDLPQNNPPAGAISLAKTIAGITMDFIRFVVIDVAEKENGEWVVVELNDAQMSGLSENDPHTLYNSLKLAL